MIPTRPPTLALIGALDPLYLLVLVLTADAETFLGVVIIIFFKEKLFWLLLLLCLLWGFNDLLALAVFEHDPLQAERVEEGSLCEGLDLLRVNGPNDVSAVADLDHLAVLRNLRDLLVGPCHRLHYPQKVPPKTGPRPTLSPGTAWSSRTII
jgi:hypothetical protein